MRVDFPYRVSELNELPEHFASDIPPAAEVVFVPPWGSDEGPYRGWFRRRRAAEPARALALGEDRLWVSEEAGGGVRRREVALDDLLEVEVGNVLLHAWVAFVPDGEDPLRLDFNLLALPIFEDLVDRILVELTGAVREERHEVPAELIACLDLKFRNVLRERLLPDEELLALAFSPAVWERRFLVVQRRVIAATALAATDRRLLVIEEGQPLRETAYGSTTYSVPRHRLAGMERTAAGVVVSFRSREGARGRLVPLSDPDAAIAVIEALGGGL